MQNNIQSFAFEELQRQAKEYFDMHIKQKILCQSPEPDEFFMPHQISRISVDK